MSKMRVYELAKQLEKDSADIIAVLKENGVEAKTHMSSIDDEAVQIVKKAFAGETNKQTETKKSEPVVDKSKKQEKNQSSNTYLYQKHISMIKKHTLVM